MYRDTNDVVSHVTRHTMPKDFLAMTYIWFPHNENALNDQFSPLSHMAIKELWYICIHIHNTYIAVWTTVVFTPEYKVLSISMRRQQNIIQYHHLLRVSKSGWVHYSYTARQFQRQQFRNPPQHFQSSKGTEEKSKTPTPTSYIYPYLFAS